MTVAELIEELKKFPPHHPVFIESAAYDLDGTGMCTDFFSIDTVVTETNIGDLGCIVKIVQEIA